ncbi:uncharacterized protein LOC143596093 [Bidens hawaiensis]|uniref:uncharacterized protein LOC143596093 n=1 Tax=Bidens hawaiensis TaxID=980011 RepID=UPI00404922A2
MTDLVAFSQSEKTIHNSHKFGFTLSPPSYGFWKTMIQPFLITNNLFGYIDGTIPSPSPSISVTSSSRKDKEDAPVQQIQPNPQHAIWVSYDAHICILLLSTISESAFQHVQGSTSPDLWQCLERTYAPHTASREYILKTQLL